MSGLTMNFKNYNNYIKTMSDPIMPSELPKGKFDFRGLISYAKEKGVKPYELSQKEKDLFVKINK